MPDPALPGLSGDARSLELFAQQPSDRRTAPDDGKRVTRAIVSTARARPRRHAEEILRHHWDLVIVDEAHKIKSHRGATYQFIEKIERDFILLLTATPLQNDLRELYNLVTLLRPGQLGTWDGVSAEHLVAGDHSPPLDPPDRREPKTSASGASIARSRGSSPSGRRRSRPTPS